MYAVVPPCIDCFILHFALSCYRSWGTFEDELAWGAAWLYIATGESFYLDVVNEKYDTCCKYAEGGSFSWDSKGEGLMLLPLKDQATSHHHHHHHHHHVDC